MVEKSPRLGSSQFRYSTIMSETSSIREQRKSGLGMIFNHSARRSDAASEELAVGEHNSGVGVMQSGRKGYSRQVRTRCVDSEIQTHPCQRSGTANKGPASTIKWGRRPRTSSGVSRRDSSPQSTRVPPGTIVDPPQKTPSASQDRTRGESCTPSLTLELTTDKTLYLEDHDLSDLPKTNLPKPPGLQSS
jgi:hypothetical protein